MIKDYNSFRLEIVNLLESHKDFSSFMVDMWANRQCHDYIDICAHFIDDHWT